MVEPNQPIQINKQRFSSVIGIAIIIIHVGLVFYVLNFLDMGTNSDANVLEIIVPFTVTYAIGVIKWVIDTQGNITSNKVVGLTYVVIVSIVALALLASLPVGLYRYQTDFGFSGEQLNWYLAGVETGFGALFSLVFSDMFAKSDQ